MSFKTTPAPSHIRPDADKADGILPVSKFCRPQDRVPCLITARHDDVEWNRVRRDFVPNLRQLPLRPGSNGVTVHTDGRLDPSRYASDLREMNYRVLMNGDHALARVVEGGIFLVRYPAQRGMFATVPFWERPTIVNAQSELIWRVDQQALDGFIARLLEFTVIEPPSESGIYALIRRTEGSRDNMQATLATLGRNNQGSLQVEQDLRNLEIRLAHMQIRLDGGDPMEFEGEVETAARVTKLKRANKPKSPAA